MLTITVLDTLDWGCPHTDDDVHAYEVAVTEAILDQYPEAEIEVSCESRLSRRVFATERDADGCISVSFESTNKCAEIEQNIEEICREIWDAGTFWT